MNTDTTLDILMEQREILIQGEKAERDLSDMHFDWCMSSRDYRSDLYRSHQITAEAAAKNSTRLTKAIFHINEAIQAIQSIEQ